MGPVSWPIPMEAPARAWRDASGSRRLPEGLVERWRRSLDAWDAPAAVRSALEDLVEPGTAVVVTGQQPGMWGGPLYCLYKAATAVALARRIGRETGRPVAAVFWMGADDADWDEVAWGTLPAADLSLRRWRWRTSPLAPRGWVGGGRVEVPEDWGALLGEWPRVDGHPGHPSPRGERDLADGFVRWLLDRLGSEGILPLDARWPELRRAGAPLWERYLDSHTGIATAVLEEGEAMRSRGIEPPLDATAADHGLFHVENDRRADPDPARWEGEVRERLEAGAGETLAPSVLLRAPLQDRLLDPCAQVVGRGEAAYLEQLRPLYRTLSIPEPVRTPRLHATILPRALLEPDRIADAVRDPEERVAERAASLVPAGASEELRDLRALVARRIDSLVEAQAAFARDLEDLGASARRRIDQQLGRLDEALDRRARQTLYAGDPRWRNLPEFLRPRRGDQDRGLSGLAADLLLGADAARLVLGMAEAHLDRLGAGEVHHFALEARHG